MAHLLERLGNFFLKSLSSILRPRWNARRALEGMLSFGGMSGAWINTWTDSRYEMVRHFCHWVYIAVDTRSTAVAMHQPNVSFVRCHQSPGDRSRWLSPKQRSKALLPLMAHQHLEPVPLNHPLLKLLQDPNEPDTSYDLWYETNMYLDLTGNSYWWIPPNSLGKPGAIWVLPAHWVFPRSDGRGTIDAYELRPIEGNYLRFTIPAEDVIHFRKKSPVSKVDGYSPQSAGSMWIDTQESVDRTRWFSFRNGIFPGVSVEFDASVKLPSEDDLNRIEARLAQRYSGEFNANRPLLIPPGARLRKMQLTPQELGFCESAEQLAEQVLALYRVPRVIVQPPSNISQGAMLAAQTGFYMSVLNPLWRFYGQHLTEKLARVRYGEDVRVWWEDRTPEDPDLQERQLNTDLAFGARTMNEVRALRNLEPYPEWWGNVPWIPLNVRPLTSVLNAPLSENGGAGGTNLATQSHPGNRPQGGEALDPRY